MASSPANPTRNMAMAKRQATTKKKKARKVSTRSRTAQRFKTVYVKDDVSWHLDRRVPVALILAMAAQIFTGIWWASSLNNDVAKLKVDVAQLHDTGRSRDTKLEQLITLQADMKNLVTTIGRLERNLDLLVTERLTAEAARSTPRK